MREIPYLFGKAHELQDVRYIRADVLVTLPCNFERKGDVLVDIFCGQKAEILKDRADITPKLQKVLLGEARDLLFAKKDRPLCGGYFSKQHFEERRLACAGVADDGYEFAGLDGEGYLGDGRRRALEIYLGDVIEINHCKN